MRYCNHNPSKNKVYYLNLFGTEPKPKSTGNLKAPKNFKIISYQNHILEWLEQCAKESYNIPILREAINQYIILIKKLTHKMDNSEDKKLHNLIINNKNIVETLVSSHTIAINSFLYKIRTSIYNKIQENISSDFIVEYGEEVNKSHSQIWIRLKNFPNTELWFGIQSFSNREEDLRNFSGLFVGIFIYGEKYNKERHSGLGKKNSNWWVGVKEIEALKIKKETKIYKANLRNAETLKKLNTDEEFYDKFIEHVATKTIEYIDDNYEDVCIFLKKINKID